MNVTHNENKNKENFSLTWFNKIVFWTCFERFRYYLLLFSIFSFYLLFLTKWQIEVKERENRSLTRHTQISYKVNILYLIFIIRLIDENRKNDRQTERRKKNNKWNVNWTYDFVFRISCVKLRNQDSKHKQTIKCTLEKKTTTIWSDLEIENMAAILFFSSDFIYVAIHTYYWHARTHAHLRTAFIQYIEAHRTTHMCHMTYDA